MLSFILQSFLVLVIGFFALYVLCEWFSLLHKREKIQDGSKNKYSPCTMCDESLLPKVSVLLPIYNEKMMLEKLLYAISLLQYPTDKLDIWILDDSTDSSKQIAQDLVQQYHAQNVPIYYASREDRKGFKAGNLNFGLTKAKGDFIAIFDADCLPEKDFLMKTMPYFFDEKIGYLQTSVKYINKDKSFLTRFQSMLAGHKDYITKGQELQNAMSSLTGSSCVWRRSCIDSIGGIQDTTISEDMDMGLRAQLASWKYAFVADVHSLSAFPESIAVLRVQRERWGRGHIQNALCHAKELLKNSMSVKTHLQACSMLFASFLLSSFYVIMLLCLPLTFVTNELGTTFHVACSIFLCTTFCWVGGMLVSKKADSQEKKAKTSVLIMLASVLMFFPLSLYYFYALIYVLLGREGQFNRTPKQSRIKSHPRLNSRLLALEIFSFIYSLIAFTLSLYFANYWVTLYSSLTLLGFGLVIALTWNERPLKNRTIIRQGATMPFSRVKDFFLQCRLAFVGRPIKKNKISATQTILITGAGGVIGSTLALEYAKSGISLILHARNADKLQSLAEQCRNQGAKVDIKTCDLENKEEMLAWVEEIKNTSLPDLIIANAGRITIATPEHGSEPIEEAEQLVRVNLLSTMRLIDGFLPYLRKRGYGQVALMSSLGGYFGIPTTPTYCATKSALRVYGDAMRAFLKKDNIKINVILPGYVRSHMVDTIPTPTPEIFILEPPRAASIIKKGLDKNRAHIAFPFPFCVGAWFMSVLPACISISIARIITRGN